jgi:agmatinase
LGATSTYQKAGWVLLGCPLEETVTFRPGTRKGPQAIRPASDGLETYSPLIGRDLEDVCFCDLGDLTIPPASGREDDAIAPLLSEIRTEAARIINDGKRLLALGGEHLVSLPLIEAALSRHTDLVVVQLDAHADLREEYEGRRLSHATVMRRVMELSDGLILAQSGIRSGTRDEFDLARLSPQVKVCDVDDLFEFLDEVPSSPIYLSLDLDILDPSALPGTGTPEPGGWTFRDLESVLHRLANRNMIGADVVELSPDLDPSGVSAVTAARCVREILLT